MAIVRACVVTALSQLCCPRRALAVGLWHNYHTKIIMERRIIAIDFRSGPGYIAMVAIKPPRRPTMVKEVETDTKVSRSKVAEHELVDANKAVVEGEEDASGIKYTLVANGKSFTWVWDEANEPERKLLAIFGAKTLATNETSQARQKDADADGQLDAVVERFGLIRSGQWVDRTREGGVGRAIDKDALAEAIVRVLLASGKIIDAQVGDTKAAKRQLLEDDATYVRKARQVPEVADEYIKIVGKPQVKATVDDL